MDLPHTHSDLNNSCCSALICAAEDVSLQFRAELLNVFTCSHFEDPVTKIVAVYRFGNVTAKTGPVTSS